VIVYSDLVEQAEQLDTLLSCPVYHSKVDTAAGKARRMREWLGAKRVIVATNAFGLRIDIPDVRLVIHAGVPRRLRDFVQESGRKKVYDQGIQEFAAE
jgi:superfamily II DNA helicase RecQ